MGVKGLKCNPFPHPSKEIYDSVFASLKCLFFFKEVHFPCLSVLIVINHPCLFHTFCLAQQQFFIPQVEGSFNYCLLISNLN